MAESQTFLLPLLLCLFSLGQDVLSLAAQGSPVIILGFALRRGAFCIGLFLGLTLAFQCLPGCIFYLMLLSDNSPFVV